MSREIIELVHELERDRGIEGDTLIAALEDALLAAYKKTPGATRHAVVELDRSEGDFRVFSIELPPDIEERLDDRERRILARIERIRSAAVAGGAEALASDAPAPTDEEPQRA